LREGKSQEMQLVGVYFMMFQSFNGAILVQLTGKSPNIAAYLAINHLDLPSKRGRIGDEIYGRLT